MKKAFSILELILAIVIIAIAVSVVPSIISSTSQSNSQALLQEAVLATKTILTNEMSKEFQTDTEQITRNGLDKIEDKRKIYKAKSNKETLNGEIKIENDASTDKNILNLNYEITTKNVKDPNFDDKNTISTTFTDAEDTSSDTKMIKVETTYKDIKGEDQKIVLTGYSFNIGEPKAGQIIIE
ncbi:prepilin-type N-terminal cleavage/methylation domain-containing protein [Campylobacter hyointestinalis]|uniref:prepilin-type N-terminal cleavage/methylation domain-containing protein n=1 Tax=Campylobacter hyointestinalis TaxID=198 RepID=UPI000DCBC56E|nr:prepilin-type N-terminal cleavage/methylation domain-containing protein [Campylobacter hyointestinalis]RAZ25371.1 hypothetical protein CHL9752_03235 [Campylobacter hyointestinalis subsp. lawsonii]RAZ38532.1 hypothetical protein CHL9426_05960 [Campylobacter hyointestinalis subsp. lawsonii]